MRKMSVYYVVVGIGFYGLNSLLNGNAEPKVARSTMIMAMWALLFIDAKLVPQRISILRSVLPGFSWIDLVAFLILCVAMSYMTFNADDTGDRIALLQVWAGGFVAMVALGVYGMVRWISWRRPKSEEK